MAVITGVVSGMMVIGVEDVFFVAAKPLVVVGARFGDLIEDFGVERLEDRIELRRPTRVRRIQQPHQVSGPREMERTRGHRRRCRG